MGTENLKTLSERIKELRKKNGLTQLQLAKKLNITDKAVSKWEAGEGNPDISLLPAIASIFDCTIDYLLTGKEPEEKIVFMSKLELCAKKDDPTILDSLDFETAKKIDENGVSLFSYVKKYNSFKVFKAMLDTCNHPTHYLCFLKNRIDGQVFVWLIRCNKERTVAKGFNCNNEIRLLNDFGNPIFDGMNRHEKNNQSISNDYDMVFSYLVENYDDLKQEQKDYYFNLDGSGMLKKKDCWFDAYPYFIDYAYRLNKDLYRKIMAKIPNPEEWRKALKEAIANTYDHSDRFFIAEYGFVNTLRSTLDCALKNNDIEEAKLINRYLARPLDDYEFNRELIMKDDSLSEKEKMLKLCQRDGLVIIDILLQTGDLKTVTSVLEEGYVTYNEFFNELLKRKKNRDLYRFFVDHQMDGEADCLMTGKYEELKERLANSLPEKLKKVELLNLSQLWEANVAEIKSRNVYCQGSTPYNCSFAYEREKELKSIIIAEFKAKQEHEKLAEQYNKATKDITKEYILELVKKGESDLAVIKLCSKLEAIFIAKYNYEGDLFSMMDNYCSQHGFEDDGWGYQVETRDSRLLHKLRLYRNSIAHPAEKGEKLSYDEFEECIKIVFSL